MRTDTTHRLLAPTLGALMLLATVGPTPAKAQTPPAPAPARAANPADVGSVDAILAALYDVISGPAGQARDWDRMRSLFAEGARLIPTGQRADGTRVMRMMLVEDYIRTSGPILERDGFFEREIGRTTEQFGQIVHAFSAYDSKRLPTDPTPFARGINSIQLRNDGTRWWVVTIFWDSERGDNPVPAKYLGGRE